MASTEGSRLFQDFKIHGILGSGSFGAVFRAEHRLDSGHFALKLKANDDSQVVNEVRNLAKLPAHDNVVAYVTSWEETIDRPAIDELKKLEGFSDNLLRIYPGTGELRVLCIQMELCGQDLRGWLQQQDVVDQSKSRHIFVQLLTGLRHVHQQQLIHRDLKPENIFFDLHDPTRIKIGDFGIATHHERGTTGGRHTTGYGLGTILYLAPEQYTSTYGRRADLYATGFILFELFHPPAQKNLELYLTELRHSKKLPEELVKWPVISRTILSLLEYDPKQRPSSETLIETLTNEEFQTLDQLDSSWLGDNFRCHNCGTKEFSMATVRYSCSVCPYYNLCVTCASKPGIHSANHKLLKIHVPSSARDSSRLAAPLNEQMRLDESRHGGVLSRHIITRCDGCKKKPLTGTRYKCVTCVDFDFCESCYQSDVSHRANHKFCRIERRALHKHVGCNGCDENPIRGILYRCKRCEDFDYCEVCYFLNAAHARQHPFRVLYKHS